ncbi:MAG: hypothetical protein JSV79_11150 [Armatimonadota bacterium]|nr:MAG: hypothetical protein JSV79_11150 [Armatimonadota bacterium]
MEIETLAELAKDGNLVSVVCAGLLVVIVKGQKRFTWPRVVLALGLLGGLIAGVWTGASSGQAVRAERTGLRADNEELAELSTDLKADREELRETAKELGRTNSILFEKIAQASQGVPMPTVDRLEVSTRLRDAPEEHIPPVELSVRKGTAVLKSPKIALARDARGEASGTVSVPLDPVPLGEAQELEVGTRAEWEGAPEELAQLRVDARLSDGTLIRLK